MIRGFLYKDGKVSSVDISKISVSSLKKENSRLWISAIKPTQEEIEILKKNFKVHPTTGGDITNPATRIKYEEFDDNTIIVFKGYKEMKKYNPIFYTLFIIDGERYVITVYNTDKNDTIDNLAKNPKKIEALLKKGEDHLVHFILDKEVDKYVELKSQISEELKLIEEKFIENQNRTVLKDLFLKEKIVLEIKQRTDSVADVCQMLTKPTDNFIPNDLIPYFRDIYDHILRVNQEMKTFLDRINSIKTSYNSLMSNKMNQTVSVLTVIMALMMPLTIITGYYGMNVKLPMQEHPLTYAIIIGMMTFIVIIMLFAFKKTGILWSKER